MIKVCTYDNPWTFCRECWRDGELVCSYSCELLPGVAKDPIPARFFFFGANIGDWNPGQLIGDRAALGE